MKGLLQVLIFVSLIGCASSKYSTVYIEHLNSRAEGERFIDSLKTQGVDTIIGYYDNCYGCWSGFNRPYYVYWDSGNIWHLTTFTNYSRFKNITGYSPPLAYLISNLEAIENEPIIKPQYDISHFSIEYVRIILGEKEIKYSTRNYEKWHNESVQKVILIDKIRSKLFGIPQWEWKSLNYKSEKRKRKVPRTE